MLRSLDLRSKGINLRQNWRRQYSSFYFHLHEDLSFNIFLPLYFSNLHSGKIAGIFLLNSSGWRQPTNFAVDIDVTYIVDKSNCFLISHHKFFLLGYKTLVYNVVIWMLLLLWPVNVISVSQKCYYYHLRKEMLLLPASQIYFKLVWPAFWWSSLLKSDIFIGLVYLFVEANVYTRCLFLRVILKLILQVNTKLKVATVKLKKTREERDQFDEASNQIVLHLKTKVNFLFVSF